jgi:hypothetical protein
LINWAALQASGNEREGQKGEEAVGAPRGEGRGEVSRIAQGEENFGGKEHESTQDEGYGDPSGHATAGEDDAEGGGEEDHHEASPGLGPAVVPLRQEGAAFLPSAIAVFLEPASELGDAEIFGGKAGSDELPRRFTPAHDRIRGGKVFKRRHPQRIVAEQFGVLEEPLPRPGVPGREGGLEPGDDAVVLILGRDDDIAQGGPVGIVVGKASDEPESSAVLLEKEEGAGSTGGSVFHFLDQGPAIAFSPRGPVVVEEEAGDTDENADHGEGGHGAGHAPTGLYNSDDFARV